MKAVLYRYTGIGANNKAMYDKAVLAEHPDYLAIEHIGADQVKVIQKGPKVVAVARLSDHDYVKLEGVPTEG